MKTLITFALSLIALTAVAAPPPPLQYNFFTTNSNARVLVQAGSNCTVTASTSGTDTRIFTVDVPTNGPAATIGVAASTTVGISTNGTVLTPFVQGTLTNTTTGGAGFVSGTITNPVQVIVGSTASFFSNNAAGGASLNIGSGAVQVVNGAGYQPFYFDGTTAQFKGNAGGLTNYAASNIVSGGVLPMGTVATNNVPSGFYVETSDGLARKTTLDGSSLTNLNASALSGGTVVTNATTSGLALTGYGTQTNSAVVYGAAQTNSGNIQAASVNTTGNITVTGNLTVGSGTRQISTRFIQLQSSGGAAVAYLQSDAVDTVKLFNQDGSRAASLVASNGTFSGTLISSNGVLNYGSGWLGTTNANAPGNTVTPVAWVNYTNAAGNLFKMPLYQ